MAVLTNAAKAIAVMRVLVSLIIAFLLLWGDSRPPLMCWRQRWRRGGRSIQWT